MSRAILGALFGALFLLFQKAGILLAVASSNEFLVGAFAVLAGFSERFIPELLQRLESSEAKAPVDRTA